MNQPKDDSIRQGRLVARRIPRFWRREHTPLALQSRALNRKGRKGKPQRTQRKTIGEEAREGLTTEDRRRTTNSPIQILSQATHTRNIPFPHGFGRRYQANFAFTLMLMLVEILASWNVKGLAVGCKLNHHPRRNADTRFSHIGTNSG